MRQDKVIFFAIFAKIIYDDDATHGLIEYLLHVIFEFYARKIKKFELNLIIARYNIHI